MRSSARIAALLDKEVTTTMNITAVVLSQRMKLVTFSYCSSPFRDNTIHSEPMGLQ